MMVVIRIALLTTERLFWHCAAHTAKPIRPIFHQKSLAFWPKSQASIIALMNIDEKVAMTDSGNPGIGRLGIRPMQFGEGLHGVDAQCGAVVGEADEFGHVRPKTHGGPGLPVCSALGATRHACFTARSALASTPAAGHSRWQPETHWQWTNEDLNLSICFVLFSPDLWILSQIGARAQTSKSMVTIVQATACPPAHAPHRPRTGCATSYPSGIAEGATFNKKLWLAVGAADGREGPSRIPFAFSFASYQG